MDLTDWARDLAESLLSEPLPRRWAHSQGVAEKAQSLTGIMGKDAELLWAAAMLHDIGYAPSLATTGFHPLDGARYLRDRSAADERLVRLVANHSCALLEAEERGLRGELEAEFPVLDDAGLVDALVYCDMTTTPDGTPTSVDARLAEILTRYDHDSIVGRFIRQADEELRAAVYRVEARLILAGQ
ncbi:metal dependent phosphohydrolase [Streptomyces davaonensis JCM 4913]|uniref:Metal dependent phosphohydrolase n=1 Tax=Streptomyces davaonensis (strain DSM 101723 / JCM 4913 / KCC S-0913 / 768) TaxID=1214101 RepID=K4REX6_STRDJ|nr:HD domain-containing protein [Streptomyces davaonensis]CCK32172.1 metal dependent phosphohydrolase [Streptomyces davaonensis JCM 4913]